MMKGQFTIVSLMVVFVTLIVYMIAVYPVLNTFITDFVAESTDENVNMVLQLIPFLILLIIILSEVFYIIPQREVVPQRY